MKFFALFVCIGLVSAQWETNYAPGHAGIVHLFEWHWDTIADECENFLGPNKFAGVQVSPPNENRVIGDRPWWERYQPVSYNLDTRSGDRAAFEDMVSRCNAVGVRIYVDAVINHMTGDGVSGTGTGGSFFDANARSFPEVPYSNFDFNDDICYTASGNIEDYGDANQVRNCKLLSLLDLKLESSYVRDKLVDYMNDLISLGVAGFRVDAVKHMWPGDLSVIYNSLNDLSTGKGFSSNSRPFLFQEVIDQGGEGVSASEYFHLGRVTEFKYGLELASNKDKLHYLGNFGEEWRLMPDTNAFVFLNNHDNQRGHGGAGEVITFEDSYNLKIFTAFMMAWDYGVPRIMSSYQFGNADEGPPSSQRNVNADGTCDNGWVCEHRWRQITNMAAFAGAAQGQPVENWWTNNDNQIAFSRGNKAFLAINKSGYTMNERLNTGMPSGSYCNVNAANVGECSGSCVKVDSSGIADISIPVGSDPVVAIHVNARCN